ncbi:MAG TPA: serine/threonine-protein kinase [Blastocatellia bacterium]|nr:serine/threonine-protein kinase [Blastocatellia bacterium]
MSSRRIGNYQITDYVGSGGFGSVFKAEDVNTPGRIVAIKELHKKHTRNQVIKQRFFQEAVAMARLDHPNLPRLFTFGEDNGSYYLVMEFISGKLLSDEIHEKGAIGSERTVEVLSQVLDAVSYAHKNGIIHRDLKPDNIILVGDLSSPRVKVLDFGIARMVGGENLTLAGEGFGTPAYMAPERITGAAGDDPRMDIYSVGIVMFEMLTGKAPFESTASDPVLYWAEMRDLHQSQPLPALSPFGVPAELEQVAMRATAKRLEQRYQAADEMLADLRNLSDMRANAPTVVISAARLQLTTAPGAAEVYVDDMLRGSSDASRGKILIDGLTGGLHTVRVLKEGYNEYRINVSLEEGRQTDLQVALSARATVAMPHAEDTAAGGFETLKLQGADDVKTALLSTDDANTAVLTVESLPVGTALFVGAEPVGNVGKDGRATIRLNPGSHEIRAATPSGTTGVRVVTVTAQDAGGQKSLTIPLSQTPATTSFQTAASAQPSRKGKQLAAAAVLILLFALAAAAYFVLRGPDRNREPVNAIAANASPAADTTPVPQEPVASKQPESNPVEDKKPTTEDKKTIETKPDKSEKKEPASRQPTSTVPNPQPPAAAVVPTPPQAQPAPTNPGGACIMVTVIDASGNPVPRVRVAVDQPDNAGSMPHGGHTGERGRWRDCGFTPGQRVRVGVFGPRGGLLGAQQSVVSAGANLVEVRLNRSMDEAPQTPMPNRKRPFYRRP